MFERKIGSRPLVPRTRVVTGIVAERLAESARRWPSGSPSGSTRRPPRPSASPRRSRISPVRDQHELLDRDVQGARDVALARIAVGAEQPSYSSARRTSNTATSPSRPRQLLEVESRRPRSRLEPHHPRDCLVQLAGGRRSAGAAAVRATRRTSSRSAPVSRATSVGLAASASSSPVRAARRTSAPRGTRRPCARARRAGSGRPRRARPRARRRPRRAGRRGRARTAPARRGRRRGAGRRSGSSRSVGRGPRRLEPRHELRDRALDRERGRRSGRASRRATARPARRRAAARARRAAVAITSSTRLEAEPPPDRRARPRSSRARRARRAPRPPRFTSRDAGREASAFATPWRRRADGTWTVVDVPAAAVGAPGARDARRRRSSSSARKTAPPSHAVASSAHSSSQVSGPKPSGSGTSALELLPELAERGLVGGRGAADVHGIREPGQEVVGREVLERVEARTELVHVEP